MFAVLALASPMASASPATGAPRAVLLHTSDHVTVYGTFYPADHPKALILLFHQAGSSKAEYKTIAPHLVQLGFSALAIDQRSGGTLFGSNQTASQFRGNAEFLDAGKDIEAAISWGEAAKRPILLWGSSYSAALVFLEAASHPEVKAVLAFSPGEYLGAPSLVGDAAAHLRMPIFVTSASAPGEIAAGRAILARAPTDVKRQYVPRHGVHGSSTLISDRDPAGAAENWAAVGAFLRDVIP